MPSLLSAELPCETKALESLLELLLLALKGLVARKSQETLGLLPEHVLVLLRLCQRLAGNTGILLADRILQSSLLDPATGRA